MSTQVIPQSFININQDNTWRCLTQVGCWVYSISKPSFKSGQDYFLSSLYNKAIQVLPLKMISDYYYEEVKFQGHKMLILATYSCLLLAAYFCLYQFKQSIFINAGGYVKATDFCIKNGEFICTQYLL